MKLINITQTTNFVKNDDIRLEFILLDDNGDIHEELEDFEYLGEIKGELKLTNDYFTVEDEKLILTIPNSVMGISPGDYDFEIQINTITRRYTVLKDSITIVDEIVN